MNEDCAELQPLESVRQISDDVSGRVDALITSLGLDAAAVGGQR